MIYLLYLLLAAAVVFFSLKCAKYVDWMDKLTSLSGAFLGGVILAAVTSLPELFTSISAVLIVESPGLVSGNVLGSNLFNLIITAATVMIYFKTFQKSFINRNHLITVFCTLGCYAALSCVALLGFSFSVAAISWVSPVIVVLYIISTRFLASDESEETNDSEKPPVSLNKVILRFIIMALLLVVASIGITLVTDKLAAELQLGSTFAGALFLGIATSLPELTSCFALCRLGNHNASIGNVVGSNMFNFLIFVVGDIIYRSGTIYMADGQTTALIVLGFISMIAAGGLIFLKTRTKVVNRLAYVVPVLVSIGSYAAFLIYSM